MEVNNKIRIASVNQYCGAFSNFDWPEILNHSRKPCLESPHKSLAWSNGRIENYDCCRKHGLLRFLRQNPNLTLLGLYHKAEPYHQVFFFICILFLLDPFKKNHLHFFLLSPFVFHLTIIVWFCKINTR